MLRKLAIAIAASGAMMSASSTYALGMGDIELDSALNQPLNARIKLLKASELEDWEIKPNLASPDEFQKSGVEHVFFLNSLKFVVERVDGDTFVQVVSDQPVVEPFLNFLVQVDWPSGRLLREYTLLLDPPVFARDEQEMDLEPAESDGFDLDSDQDMPAAPAMQSSDISDIPDFEESSSSEMMADESDLSEPQTPVVAAKKQAPIQRTYQVKPNDTLWEVAVRTRGNRNISPQQAMLAIQDLNPDAFINGNINRLKKNQTLDVPTEAQMFSRTFKESVAEVAQQNSAFATRKAQLDATRKNSVIERDSAVSGAELKLLAGGSATANGDRGATGEVSATAVGDQSSLAQDLSLALENLDKSSRENTELRSRLDSLEDQISTLQRLINLKDEQMVALQTGMGATDPVTSSVSESGAVSNVVSDALDSEEIKADTQPVSDLSVQDKAAADLNFASTDEAAVKTENDAAPVKPKPKFVYQPEEIVEEPFDPVAFAIENPPVLLGALASLILALFGIKYSRKKKEEAAEKNSDVVENDFTAHDPLDHVDAEIEGDFDDEFSDLDLSDDTADTDFEAADLDDFESPDMGLPDSLDDSNHESSDVIGEVDVYLAYNRMDPAKDLLEKTLVNQPDRMDLRLKLLEVLSEMDDEDAFAEQFDYVASNGSVAEQAKAQKIQSAFQAEGGSDDLSLDALADFDSGDSEFGLDLEDNELNFDLDGLDLTTEDTALQPTLSEENTSLDFDLDIDGELEALDANDDLTMSSGDGFDGNDLDFELDTAIASDELDGSDLESELSFGSESTSDGNAVSFELNESESDLDFEIPELSESNESELDLGGLDTGDLDIELSSFAETKPADELVNLDGFEESSELDIELGSFESLDDNLDPDAIPSLGASDFEEKLSFETADIPELEEELDLDLDLESDSNMLSDLDALDAQLNETDEADLDLSLPELESDLDDAVALDMPSDLDSLDADLSAGKEEPFAEALPDFEGDVDLDDLEGDLDFLSGTDESETKLDLARAYIDMDDQEGAREILQEVLDDGSDIQKQEANKLLDSMA